jgi:hypothetical protein
MKIEDSNYYANGASAVDKLRRAAQANPLDVSFDNIDLSFLDMLTSVVSEALPVMAGNDPAPEPVKEKPKTMATDSTQKETQSPPKLTLVGRATADDQAKDAATRVDKDMVMFRDEMTAMDVQYMKQAVIPGLPILVGTVPFDSIFSPSSDGEISYRGFDVSPKLAELIEKGYRTGQAIRVELDPNSSVVLKIRNGQVSADFVSNDKAAALSMQHELDDLRNRMMSRNLPVGSLEYKYRDSNSSGSNRNPQDDSPNYTDDER